MSSTSACRGVDTGNYTLVAPGGLTANITAGVADGERAGRQQQGLRRDHSGDAERQRQPDARLGSDIGVGEQPSTGTFADKNVGTGKAVAVGGLSLSGTDAGNYTLTQPGSLTADITPASLTVSGLVANNKVYDATDAGDAERQRQPARRWAATRVSVSSASTGTFSDKNVGTGKAVAVSGLTLSGADAGNYTLTQPTGLSADITPATAVGERRCRPQQGLRRDHLPQR